MPLNDEDRVRETSTTTGAGSYSLDGAAAGYRGFVAAVGSGNLCHYLAEEGTSWELGIGTVTDATPDTLARTVVLKSTNGDAAVSWGAGTRTISCVHIATDRPNVVNVGRSVLGSAGPAIGPLIVPQGVTSLWGTAFIKAPGTVVPRLLLGGAAIDTGTNYCGSNNRPNVSPVTQVSLRGWGLLSAALANTNEALITFNIRKPAAAERARAIWQSSSISIVASTAPTQEDGCGLWVNTADLIQRIELHGYSAITGTTDANMSAGTELQVYGSYDF